MNDFRVVERQAKSWATTKGHTHAVIVTKKTARASHVLHAVIKAEFDYFVEIINDLPEEQTTSCLFCELVSFPMRKLARWSEKSQRAILRKFCRSAMNGKRVDRNTSSQIRMFLRLAFQLQRLL
ncbi:hypothetical protein CEXT_488221 [Caerostris extrusa]|uniref:Uncharacterized protein n=1 Tax=Caerostris extrusa TaxID=172846 RepID=A0AAV4XF59_CAEEX|nr:hypothetical protein CEXT_488221 [Caerostris extrusa]